MSLTQSQHNGNATAGAATGGATARRAVTFQTPVNTDTPDAVQQYQQQHYAQQQSADASQQQQHDEHGNDVAMLVQQQEQQQAAADAQSLEELKALMELFHIMCKYYCYYIMSDMLMYTICCVQTCCTSAQHHMYTQHLMSVV
jgi:maltooligosyltrehalose synthase